MLTSSTNFASADSPDCAANWNLSTWWNTETKFKYAPIFGTSNPNWFSNSTTQANDVQAKQISGIYAPSLSAEALSKVKSKGSEIFLKFFISKDKDLNFDSSFRPFYDSNQLWLKPIKVNPNETYTELPISTEGGNISIFPNSRLATRIEIEQPNCEKYSITSPYVTNGNFELPKIGSEFWNSYWKAVTTDFKRFEQVKVWEKYFLGNSPNVIAQENAVIPNRWYYIFQSDIFSPTVINYDFSSCKPIKTISQYEKDTYKLNWEMMFLENQLYGNGMMNVTRGESIQKCTINLYFLNSDYRQTPYLFDLGKKEFQISAKPKNAPSISESPQAIASSAPKPIVSKGVTSKITCIKGKNTAVITGKNPKCPVGYKKK